MNDPLFYTPDPASGVLSPQEAHHAARVLRLRKGDEILVTDGKGSCFHAVLQEVSQHKVSFIIRENLPVPTRDYQVRIAVAPTRKPDRNEWMIEKLVEFGLDELWFVKTTHTHLETFNRVVNPERIEKIAVSAMKQSGQFTLPRMHYGTPLDDFLSLNKDAARFIAYVPDKGSAPHLLQAASGLATTVALIGPEGDFTPEEVKTALSEGFRLVSLGATRLRTETAALAACHALHLANIRL